MRRATSRAAPTWSGDKRGYDTALAITAAPRVLDFTLPVAGGVSGSVTSEAGGVPSSAYATFYDLDRAQAGYGVAERDGTYETRNVWAGTYTVQFNGTDHVAEWWKDALPENATTITVKPGEVTTGISAALTKDVKAVERPELTGNAWVGKTLRIDEGRWNTQGDGSGFTYEWLAGSTVVATGPSLKVTKAMLGKKLTGRVTNDAGFAQGQAITTATPKVGYQPKVKAKVSAKSATITLKVKPLKAKKVKATITVFEIVGVKKNGDDQAGSVLGKATSRRAAASCASGRPSAGQAHARLLREGQGHGRLGDIQKSVKPKR